LNRRRFLKYAGATGGVLLAGALGYEFNPFATPVQTQISTTTATQRRVATQTTSSTSTTEPNVPYVVRDLDQQIQPYFNDLTSFANGQIANSEMKANSPTYSHLLQNAESLRDALRKYTSPNQESEGQAKRLDQLALSGLHLYSWTSRLQEDDLKILNDHRFDPPQLKAASGEVLQLLDEEIAPSSEFTSGMGKFQTDVSTENNIAPSYRPNFAILYNYLDGDLSKIEAFVGDV
jgi:hypothetical protein